MRTLEHTVTQNEAGQSLKTLVPAIFHLSTHAFRRLKVQNGICVNGIPRHVSATVSTGDILTVHLLSDNIHSLHETEMKQAEQPDSAMPVFPGNLIPYLDEDILIANKPAPLATLPGRFTGGDTLRERLASILGLPAEAPYHPVNRLDKGTSGLLCIARHDHAQHLLTRALHTGAFIREYLAVTDGIPSVSISTIDKPIAREGSGARRIIRQDGKPAITRYTVLYSEPETRRALVRLNLETGRTHQIRVHLASIGCPIVGDYLYGHEHPELINRFALHSAHLKCHQPITNELIDITAPFPDVLASLFSEPMAVKASISFEQIQS